MLLDNIEKKIVSLAEYEINKKGNRALCFYLFKFLMVLQPLKIIRDIGQKTPSIIGFFCTISSLLISISALLTLWIPEGVLSSEVIKGQSQCCDMIVGLYNKRKK